VDWEYICIIRDSPFRVVLDCLTGPCSKNGTWMHGVILNDGRMSKQPLNYHGVRVLMVVFSLVDIIVFISMTRLLLGARYSAEEPEHMEFRNPYLGLDELYSYHKIKPSRYNIPINEPLPLRSKSALLNPLEYFQSMLTDG